ncbi:LysM peptidoglycan-binding domain-containing protein [Oscillibacter hominis]|uniref:LysM peptidoglycan-binding domain-containing protein n=1 Tax=Oscillibacter hominis TaxID=2763056 RepID=A0A7G9B830_9FIRM|nr:LysM peptidoglycan-binding domain-containing protein [Oscillibacter hominis]QNL45711.1 LysM peptidoglycan-binding domain-containing protein [Oscillibacter hominis]
MLRTLTFLDEAARIELTLPVTPSTYSWTHHNTVETVSLDQTGEVNLGGVRRMGSTTLKSCLFPAQLYPFCVSGAVADPWHYLMQIERWIDAKTTVRFLVSGTPTNALVLIESLEYREQDGTNDYYADIAIRQTRTPAAAALSAAGTVRKPARQSKTGAASARTYAVAKGDTLWHIAKKFYGDGSLCCRLAAANPSIKNPDLIYPGQQLTIPALNALPGAASLSGGAAMAAKTEVVTDDATGKCVLKSGGAAEAGRVI